MKRTILSMLLLFMVLNSYSNTAPQPLWTNPFIGMWGLDIKGGGAGWLNVHEDHGFLDAELLWIGGSVVPVSNIYLVDENTLVATRTYEVKRSAHRSHTVTYTLEVKKVGEALEGTMSGPKRNGNGISIKNFTGKRMPPLPDTPDLSKLKFEKPIKLFNGKDLTGWKLMDPSKANGFKVKDGMIVNDPIQPKDGEHISYGNIRTLQEFNDFNLKLEVNVPEGNNSGIYLRGLYEIQVVDSYGKELDSHNMGALYSRITPSEAAEKPAGEWQTLDITLVDRHLTVIFNGKKIIDNQPVWGPTGGAISSDVLSPGPIYLQGDHGNVAYRNIVLTPIK
ncbi:DUF1080 domain-containing protein [Arenibacter sp. M-2]|uniref:3-keto-disaccharide hydrolase n=1 Tax=unclassified Arenibacter TaxID=2615047 RepID=UPI000D773AB7|nr:MULTISPECIES: DUF1080 domain-containing protein [unclassified Arenibacter]MDL5512185.1 DUF1080 domain-containing protein [Arenibacter sp. M-2]PXX26527.1 uncharacterized protein DUF1080 [Arenibacter sp. ARW7G5Y1]|tara:strand:+ start:3468 stop:4472 length:1005 start_codon:yes stop_codon:yes gene_type:complete